jgi:hypothetical protein
LLLHLQNPIDYYASLKQKNYSKPWKWIPTAGEQRRIPMALFNEHFLTLRDPC